jgi:hypothetical protein
LSATRDRLLTYLVHVHAFALEVPFKGLNGKRRWRWDAALDTVAVEYSGFGPGHQWNAGVSSDYEKVTEGQLCGWTVIVCNSDSVNSGKCIAYVEAALAKEGA